jgi:hypothetical protein
MNILPKQMAVAVMDILGFTQTMKMRAMEESVGIIHSSILSADSAFMKIQHDFDNFGKLSGTEPPHLNYLYFADTIFMYLSVEEHTSKVLSNPSQIILSLSYAVALTLGYCMRGNIPVRGAISYGDCYISEEPVFAVGKPIVEAYELEKSQDWAGVAIAKSAEQILTPEGARSRPDFLIKYAIPLKKEVAVSRPRYAVNWPVHLPRIFSSSEPIPGNIIQEPNWNILFSNTDADSDITKKRQNTETFFHHVADSMCTRGNN